MLNIEQLFTFIELLVTGASNFDLSIPHTINCQSILSGVFFFYFVILMSFFFLSSNQYQSYGVRTIRFYSLICSCEGVAVARKKFNSFEWFWCINRRTSSADKDRCLHSAVFSTVQQPTKRKKKEKLHEFRFSSFSFKNLLTQSFVRFLFGLFRLVPVRL